MDVPRLPRMGTNSKASTTTITPDAISLSLAMPLLSGNVPMVLHRMKNNTAVSTTTTTMPNSTHQMDTDASASLGELRK